MKKIMVAFFALAAAFAISPAAFADAFNYTYTAGSITATGTLDASLISPGTYGITGGTITLAGGGITGTGIVLADPTGAGTVYTFENPPNSGGANLTIDNLLFPAANPQFDDNGFAFELTSYAGPAGGIWGEIWGNGAGDYGIYEGSYNIFVGGGGSFSATPSPTPEPSSLLLLGSGLLSVAGGLYRKVRASR